MKRQPTYQKPMINMCYMENIENLLVALSSGSQNNDQALSREWSHDDDATEPASRTYNVWEDDEDSERDEDEV